MIRYSTNFLSFKWMSVLVLLGMSSMLWANDTNTRLINVERITQSHTQLIQDLQNQINDMNQDIDTLRGEVQVLQYQLQQSVSRQKEILLQLDNDQSKPDSSITTKNHTVDNVVTAPVIKSQAGSNVSAQDASNVSGTASKNTVKEQTTQTHLASINPLLKQQQFNFSGDDQKDYNAIIALILTDRNYYPEGLMVLKEFVKHYPDSRYLANAYYWIGQLSYATGDKEQAIYYFALVVKDYPKSEKTQDAMYKVALLLQEKGQFSNAKAIYHQILKLYPTASIATQAQKQLDFLSKQRAIVE